MKIGVFIGSFDPPHKGHKKVVDYLLEKKIVDKVLWIPTTEYWYKEKLSPIEERINILKKYETENIIVEEHSKENYTYEIMRNLKKEYQEDELYLIIGSDNLEQLHKWKNIQEILKNKVIVVKRGKIIKNEYLKEYEKQIIYIKDFSYLDISSTEIKKGLKKEERL